MGFKSQYLLNTLEFSGILLEKKISIPGNWYCSGFCLRDFSGEEKQIPGIWEWGSRKKPIPKPPLIIESIYPNFVITEIEYS